MGTIKTKILQDWEDRRDSIFPHLCLVERVKKLRDEKRFCLIEKKNERIENVICVKKVKSFTFIKK